MNKQLLIKVGFVLTAVVSGFVFSACSGGSTTSSSLPKELTPEEKKAKEGREALEAKKAEYTTIPGKEQLAKEPYRKKKLLFYRFNKDFKDKPDPWVSYFDSSVSYATNQKLEFILAKNPDEVGIIALLPECKDVKAGYYSGAAWAFKEQCELILIDRELSAVVYRKIFEGELESSKTISKGESSVTAKVEHMKIVDFLDSLKEKTDASPVKTDKK